MGDARSQEASLVGGELHSADFGPPGVGYEAPTKLRQRANG
jgi:hypothetical protein